MKLRDVLESRYNRGTPFQVTSVLYKETEEEGEIEIPVTVSGHVTSERDPYGTGDSPTSYEVTIDSVEGEDGTEYEEFDLSDRALDQVQSDAIHQVA